MRSVCLCLSVCLWVYLWNCWTDLHKIVCADLLWPSLGPPLVALRYVMYQYFWFYGWHYIWRCVASDVVILRWSLLFCVSPETAAIRRPRALRNGVMESLMLLLLLLLLLQILKLSIVIPVSFYVVYNLGVKMWFVGFATTTICIPYHLHTVLRVIHSSPVYMSTHTTMFQSTHSNIDCLSIYIGAPSMRRVTPERRSRFSFSSDILTSFGGWGCGKCSCLMRTIFSFGIYVVRSLQNVLRDFAKIRWVLDKTKRIIMLA